MESFIDYNRAAIDGDARQHRLDPRGLETQVRLHLPRFRRGDLVDDCDILYRSVREHAIDRSVSMREACRDAQKQAWSSSLLLGGEVVRRDLSILRRDGSRYPLRFDRVPPAVGYMYQERLHYLHHARTDTRFEFGLFLGNAAYPITYLAFSPCDRLYMVDALNAFGVKADRSDVLVLTRVYGLPNIPPGSLSLTISRALRTLRMSASYRFIITAVNPMLAFRGTAFLASGFVPFATAPVTYGYDDLGYFATRRQCGSAVGQQLDAPENVLAVFSLDKRARRRLDSLQSVVRIPQSEYGMNRAMANIDQVVRDREQWMRQLEEYRRRLESGWSASTLHPSYRTDQIGNPTSRGQCGVSSVWLARELRNTYHVEATYCYGRLSFDQPRPGEVSHHCWLEVGETDDRWVIDITSDQAEGWDQRILCERHHELRRRGIRYEAGTRLRLDQLRDDRVWDRFSILRGRLDSEGAARTHGRNGRSRPANGHVLEAERPATT